jgi:Spy/CpxP family protein refolding chaperone
VKRSWISLAVAVVVLAVAAPSAQAQGGPPQRGGGARMVEMLMKDITLDAAQKTKLEAIQAKYAKELPVMTPGERPGPEAMAKRREVMTKQQDEIRTILTTEQQAVYDKNLAAQRERMPRRGS